MLLSKQGSDVMSKKGSGGSVTGRSSAAADVSLAPCRRGRGPGAGVAAPVERRGVRPGDKGVSEWPRASGDPGKYGC